MKKVKPLIFKEKPAPHPSGDDPRAVTIQGQVKQTFCSTPEEVDKLGSILEYCEMNAGGK